MPAFGWIESSRLIPIFLTSSRMFEAPVTRLPAAAQDFESIAFPSS